MSFHGAMGEFLETIVMTLKEIALTRHKSEDLSLIVRIYAHLSKVAINTESSPTSTMGHWLTDNTHNADNTD